MSIVSCNLIRNFKVDKDLVDNDLRIAVYSMRIITFALFIRRRYTYGTLSLFECTFLLKFGVVLYRCYMFIIYTGNLYVELE